jgi:RNA polymerase sigma-70 factor (ECF subfamily)
VSRVQTTPSTQELEGQLEQYRPELTAHCYRMLASPFEAEDAVQETFIRAWRNLDSFEGRASLRSWLYKIATNVCLDMLGGKERRARPMDFGPAQEPVESNLNVRPEATWIQPIPDPSVVAESHETTRLALVAALQHLPPKQRAVLILCEVLRWKASEVAELLDTSVASVNSALQRARATLEEQELSLADASRSVDEADEELLSRYVAAFEAYDVDALIPLIQEDAIQSMPPFDMWLAGREDIFRWWFGPGIGCKGSRVIPTTAANGSPAFGQYKPSDTGSGYDPWALQVLEIEDGKIVELTFFLDTETLFPLFGLPPRLDA